MWDEVTYPFLTLNGARGHRLSFSMLFNVLFTTVYHTCRYDSFMICLCYFSELNFWSSILLLVINGAHYVLTDRQYGMHILEIRNWTHSQSHDIHIIYVCMCVLSTKIYCMDNRNAIIKYPLIKMYMCSVTYQMHQHNHYDIVIRNG